MAPSRDDLEWLYGQDNGDTEHLPSIDAPHDTASPLNPPRRGRQSFVEQPPATREQPVVPVEPAPTPPRPAPQPAQRRLATPPSGRPGHGGGNRRPPQPPTGARPQKRRRRHPVRNFLVFVVVVVVAFAIYLVGVPAAAWSKTAEIDVFTQAERPPRQPGKTYLLVGSDSREGLSEEDKRKLGTGDAEGGRTDTMMLLVVPDSGEPAVISLPRDSYVEIPGKGSNKLNAAYSYGGAELLVATVEQATGVRVDEYLEIGFGGFVNVIDALGGIEMCLDEPIQDRDSHLDVPAGCQVMDGTTALGYVRMRKADPRGDLGRVERQREMLAAMAAKAADPKNVLFPSRYWALSNAAASSVTVDEGTGMFETARMAQAFLNVSRGKGLSLSVPISNPNASTDAGSAVLWDEAGAQEMFGTIAQGSTEGLEKFAKKE